MLIMRGVKSPARQMKRRRLGNSSRRLPSVPSRTSLGPCLWRVSAFVLVAAAGCGSPERLTHLPLRNAEMIKIGWEARPARRVPHNHQLAWTIPASVGGKIELAFAVAPDDPEPNVGATIRIYRRDASENTLLKALNLTKSENREWLAETIVWPSHSKPLTLALEVETSYGGEPEYDPLLAPAIVAEPVLVPQIRGPNRRDFVLFLIDTLRADKLGCYGVSGAAATPEIDRLSREGFRADRALSPANWTLPAHASLFTSRNVARHQVGGLRQSLARDLPTLGEALQRSGYRTLAVTNGGFVDPSFGLGRGFDRYWTVDLEKEDVHASVQRALSLLDRYRGEPVFLFFHTFRVHDYAHRLGFDPETLLDRVQLASQVGSKYSEGIADTDMAFGELRQELAAKGLASRTAILLTSDHGEMLDDRPGLSPPFDFFRSYGHHHPYLYDEELRVPLIFYDPVKPGKGEVLKGPVSLLDVAPTVLDVLELPAESVFEGVSLRSISRRPSLIQDRLLVSEDPVHQVFALERSGRKRISRPTRTFHNWLTGGIYPPLPTSEAYDLSRDPRETHSLVLGGKDFADLRGEAQRLVAEGFPGCIVLCAPASSVPLELTVNADSGLRTALLYAAKERDSASLAPDGKTAEAKILPGPSDVWIIIEPRRPFDLVRLAIKTGDPVQARLGDGSLLKAGETRLRWKSLLRKSGSPTLGGRVLLSASSLKTADRDTSSEKPLPPELLAQLRSLGYLSMPSAEVARHASPGSNEVFKQPGPDLIVVKLLKSQ